MGKGIYERTEETRRKMSEVAKKRKSPSKEARQKMSKKRKEAYSIPENRIKQSEIMKKWWKDHPEKRKQVGRSTKNRYKDPQVRQEHGKLMKLVYENTPMPEKIKRSRKISKATEKQWRNPDVRTKMVVGLKSAWGRQEVAENHKNGWDEYVENNPEYKKWYSERTIEFYSKNPVTEEAKKEQSEKLIKFYQNNLEARLHQSKKTKEFFENNPEARLHLSEIAKKQFEDPRNHPQWRGGISCDPYCDAWADQEYKADLKERDDNMCMNPDCWNTSETLCLHHIDYDKKNCSPSNLITVCTSCNSRANSNRENHTLYYQDLMTEFYGYEYEQQLSLLEAVNQ